MGKIASCSLWRVCYGCGLVGLGVGHIKEAQLAPRPESVVQLAPFNKYRVTVMREERERKPGGACGSGPHIYGMERTTWAGEAGGTQQTQQAKTTWWNPHDMMGQSRIIANQVRRGRNPSLPIHSGDLGVAVHRSASS